MKIEEVIKTRRPIPVATKTLVNIINTSALLESKIHAVLKPYGLSMPQYNVLRILRGQESRPASMRLIQERMVKPMSNTTRLVDKLVDKGLVTRKVCADNRRQLEIRITGEGLALLSTLDPLIEGNDSKMMSPLDEKELETLNTLLNRIRQ